MADKTPAVEPTAVQRITGDPVIAWTYGIVVGALAILVVTGKAFNGR